MVWTQKGQWNQEAREKIKENLSYQFGLSQLLLHISSLFEPDTSLHHAALLNGKQTGTALQTTVRVLKFKEELNEVWF